MTRTKAAITILLAAAGTAAAQDSVSLSGVSDALRPYAADGQQAANYVVDLTAFSTSWGTEFGIAPILKTTQTDVAFNNNLGSAQSMSRSSLLGVATNGGNYMLWNAAGGGINTAIGQTSSTVNPPATVNRLAAGMTEFGLNEYNGIVGGGIEYDPANPGRLFVARRHVAQTLVNAADLGGSASIGGIAVSNNGDFFFRADAGFPAVTGTNALTANNIYRTNLAGRNMAGTNLLDVTGAGLDSTTWIAQESGSTITVPNFVPGTNVVASGTFGTEYGYGSGAGVFTVDAPGSHLGLGGGDHRGSFSSTSRFTLDPSGVATLGVLGRDGNGPFGTDYAQINLWSVDATGARVGSPVWFDFPATYTDHDATAGGYSYDRLITGDNPASFRSQTSFQGGIGQAAIGMDQQGRGLAGLYYTAGGSQNNPDNHMVAVRFDPTAVDPTASAEYAMVAWTYFDAVVGSPTENMYLGKDITDGAGTVIGKLVPLDAVTGGTPFGPSFSPAAIDSAGNFWFQSSVALYGRVDANLDGVVDALDDVDLDGDGILDSSDTDGALIRAVYDPSNANGPAWELELVLELGTQVAGSNSGTAWRIDFMGTADSNSLSSGTFFSSNAAEQSFNGFDVSGLDTADSRTNGGVVVNASISYDVDGDGSFDPDLGIDQDYNALLYIGNLNAEDPAADPCLAIDFNGDGILDNGDIGAFVGLFLGGNLSADINGDGILDNGDIGAFVALFLSCAG